jgi:thioredoxin 1
MTDLSPERTRLEQQLGPTVLEFGASWCGYCQAARPLLAHALADFPHVRYLAVEDGPGKRLGRSYGVTLWPTFVFLIDGKEVTRLVRPSRETEIRQALEQIATPLPSAAIE